VLPRVQNLESQALDRSTALRWSAGPSEARGPRRDRSTPSDGRGHWEERCWGLLFGLIFFLSLIGAPIGPVVDATTKVAH
jgi:hypothetical protein